MGAQAVRLSNVDINNALENKDFEVLFQPIFDLGNGGLARMETFVRWRHPTLGVLPPGAFISFFESQGRMGELTRYVLDGALEHYAAWRGPYAPGFSINLALADLTDEDFPAHLNAFLKENAFPADLVTLECPMPVVDADMDAMAERFDALRQTGARLAIEVRGRANDFLRSVDPFPFDEIKTGGSSILRFARTVRGPGLSAISDLLDIANKSNAVTTAVGVEDQASLAALKDLGFTAAQGNHLGKVGSLSDFRPARVNDVRKLLDLPALSSDELTALFRTAAPEPKAAAERQPTQAKPAEAQKDEDKTVEASAPETVEDGASDIENAQPAEKTAAEKQALLERARKKAKAIARAKRAKARDARKAAAIKRAKAKVAAANATDGEDITETPDAAPRDMQDRLTREFEQDAAAPAEDAGAPAGVPETAPAETDEPPSDAVAAGASAEADAQQTDRPTETEAPPDRDSAAPDPPQEAPARAATSEARNDLQLKLPIGPARAFFRPGVSVRSTPSNRSDEPAASVDAAPAQAGQPALRDDPAPQDTRADEPKTEEQTPEEPLAEALASAEGDQSPDQQPARAVKRRKNFLTRKYKVVPTHFWPKSWKRAWRRARAGAVEGGAEA